MTVVTTLPEAPFLDIVAQRWLDDVGLPGGDGVILVPSRRSARALNETFLRLLDGRPALLPRTIAIGDLDGDSTGFGGAAEVDLPPAVEPERRLAVLSALVLKAGNAFSTLPTIDQAWPLAKALADLMDDAERVGVDLAEGLPNAADPHVAAHWEQTLEFLRIVTDIWPQWLREAGVINPAAREVMLLRAQAEAWRHSPPAEPIWAAGFVDALAGTREVLRAVAMAPRGVVILPGIDRLLPSAIWDNLPDTHPQAGPRRVLAALETSREAVSLWDDAEPRALLRERAALMSTLMLPAGALSAWTQERAAFILEGLSRLDAADQQQEAVAIAMILRHAIEKPGRRAALVTPDRALARRVATELLRFGVVADDSAGESLAMTPAAVFLRLLADAVAQNFSPIALLALLKHPLTALGMSPGNCRATARRLERVVLRGPAPPPGLDGIRRALASREGGEGDMAGAATADRPDTPAGLEMFLDRFSEAIGRLEAGLTDPLPDLLEALLRAAEALTTTDVQSGADRLWAGAEGHALARLMARLLVHTAVLPAQDFDQLPAFLLSAMAGAQVQGQRVLQGREGEALHPRVAILGLLEARLQSHDLVVLGGLNEGVWPPTTDPGPWLSRPMRRRVGLISPERAIGTAAQDFVRALLTAPDVVLSAPSRREGAPAVPARWLVRLDALLEGRGQSLPRHPALAWQAMIDQPQTGAHPVPPPVPRPPVALRPRRLSVTEIETWLRDPYAIYARHVLGLTALPELEEAADRSDIGVIVHDGLEDWLKGGVLTAERLTQAFDVVLEARQLRPALAAWWRVRLGRIASWVAEQEAARPAPVSRALEVPGRMTINAPAGAFTLSARADRIDLDAEGRATIIDYKTGSLPSQKDVEAGWSAQLVLEAAMLRVGAFASLPAAEAASLLYWRLTGDRERGQERALRKTGEDLTGLVEEAASKLAARIAAYDHSETPYRAQPHPGHEPRYSDYALLARVAEWSAAQEEAES